MELRLHQTFLPHLDPDASLALYRDVLGFEVREDVGSGAMRWLTLATEPGPAVVLGPPVPSPGVTDQEHRTVLGLMAKGVYAGLALSTTDLAGTFARLEGSGAAEVIQEPVRRPFGGHDCVFLDPAGNLIRIVERR